MKVTIILFAFVIFGCSADPQLGRFNLFRFGDRINAKLGHYQWNNAPVQQTVLNHNFNPFKWYNLFEWLNSFNWLNPFDLLNSFEWFGNGKSAGPTNGFLVIEVIIEIISKLQAAIDNGQRIRIIEIIRQLKREMIKLRSLTPSKYHLYIVNIFVNLNELQQLAIGGDLTAVRSIFAKLKNSFNSIGKTVYNRKSLAAQIQIIFTMIQSLQNDLSSGRTKDASLLIELIVTRLRKYLTSAPASIRSYFRAMLNLFIKLQRQVSMGHTQSINGIYFEIVTLLKRMSRIVNGSGNIEAWWGGHSGLVAGSYTVKIENKNVCINMSICLSI